MRIGRHSPQAPPGYHQAWMGDKRDWTATLRDEVEQELAMKSLDRKLGEKQWDILCSQAYAARLRRLEKFENGKVK